MNENFGYIETIEADKFICEGSIYINGDYANEQDKEVSVTNLIHKIGFDAKINSIINEAVDNTEDKSSSIRTLEIENFIEESQGRLIDLIFFPDTGIRGTNKVVLSENSIVYISVSNNLKLGFFVNKALAKYMFGGNNEYKI